MSLPKKLPYELMLTQWGSQLDPVIANPIVQGVALTGITLVAGTPKTIPTTLNRQQQGWILTDNTANAVIFRTQPFNANNLTLQSNVNTTISVWVF